LPRRPITNNSIYKNKIFLQDISPQEYEYMKASKIKAADTAQTPVFDKMLHRVRTRPKKGAPNSKLPQRENTFSKSRDTREDRGARQMKTEHSSQTFPHGR
jgi:hypothetical protein